MDDNRKDWRYRPYRADRFQRKRRTASRNSLSGPPPAVPIRPPGARWTSLLTHRRRGRRHAEDRARAVTSNDAVAYVSEVHITRQKGPLRIARLPGESNP